MPAVSAADPAQHASDGSADTLRDWAANRAIVLAFAKCRLSTGALDCSDTGMLDVPYTNPNWVVMRRRSPAVLNFNDNSIETVAMFNFAFAPGVKDLRLARSRIKNIAHQAFAGCNELERLDLDGNLLTELGGALGAPISWFSGS